MADDPVAAAAAKAKQDAKAAAAAAERKKPVPWGLFLRSSPVWAVIVAHFCFNWGYYTLLAWLPSYFEMALGERALVLLLGAAAERWEQGCGRLLCSPAAASLLSCPGAEPAHPTPLPDHPPTHPTHAATPSKQGSTWRRAAC